MKLNATSILSIIFRIALSSFYISELNAETETEKKQERKKIHIYITPRSLSNYTDYTFRRRIENKTFSILYGFTQNFYFGLTYSRGKDPEDKLLFESISSSRRSEIKEYSRSRLSEYFVLRSQYFIWGNIYGSLNFGLEKGYRIEERNFLYVRGNSIDLQPYSKTTIYSDRYFTTLGIGYRKEFLNYFIIGTELEYGRMSAGNINQHYTFDPNYYGGLPINYIIDQLIIRNNAKEGSGEFSYISIYAGIAI